MKIKVIFITFIVLLTSMALPACDNDDNVNDGSGRGNFKMSVNGAQQWENDIVQAFCQQIPGENGYLLKIISKKTSDHTTPSFNLTYRLASGPGSETFTFNKSDDIGTVGYHTDGSIEGFYSLEDVGSITVAITKTAPAASGTITLMSGTFHGTLVNQDDEQIEISGSFDDKAYPDYD